MDNMKDLRRDHPVCLILMWDRLFPYGVHT